MPSGLCANQQMACSTGKRDRCKRGKRYGGGSPASMGDHFSRWRECQSDQNAKPRRMRDPSFPLASFTNRGGKDRWTSKLILCRRKYVPGTSGGASPEFLYSEECKRGRRGRDGGAFLEWQTTNLPPAGPRVLRAKPEAARCFSLSLRLFYKTGAGLRG